MDTLPTETPASAAAAGVRKALHPLVATAAIAVIVVSALAAITLVNNQASAQADHGAGAAKAAGGRPTVAAAPASCRQCGVVSAVRLVRVAGEGTGAGVVAGGLVGGLAGHAFGKGSGKDVTTILGAVGGAVAGHQVEKQMRSTTRYEVDVRLDAGPMQTVSQASDPGPIVGQRVRVENGRLVRDPEPAHG